MTGKAAKFFQISQLTEWQIKTIQATIEGRNSVVVQPTGSGKSLCFQLPPLISGRLSVVITPTISLMQDQAVSLQEKGIKATFLGSTQKDPSVTGQLAQGTMDVVFVTVERFFAGGRVDPLFIKMASDGKIGLIAVDEAHLIISWKSFRYYLYFVINFFNDHYSHHRPDYTRLSQLSSLFPNLPLMALTATAPPGVLEQIVHVIPDPVISQGSVNQPNISYRVFERQNDGRGKL